MSDVFISYASPDRDRAKELAEALSARGYSVWWDRTIPPGRVFDEVIQEAIESARCMVVLWSANSVRSNWVKTEAAEGVTRGILVPAMLGDAAPPIEFKRIQSANLSQWNGEENQGEFRNLLDSIERLLKQGAKPTPSRQDELRPVSSNMRAPEGGGRFKTFGIGLVCGLVVAGGMWIYGRRTAETPPVQPPPEVQQAAPAAGGAAAPAPAPSASPSTAAAPTTAGTQSPAVKSAAPAGRTNLLSAEAGGQLLVASHDKWNVLIDGKEDTYAWTDHGFGVFGFRDGRTALIDTFTVLVASQNDNNLKDFELFVSNASPTGPFESIGRFSTQNMRMIQEPYQAFHFPPVKAKYFKLQSLRSHGGSVDAIYAYEFQLFGTLQ